MPIILLYTTYNVTFGNSTTYTHLEVRESATATSEYNETQSLHTHMPTELDECSIKNTVPNNVHRDSEPDHAHVWLRA